jgi:hypothetical protein
VRHFHRSDKVQRINASLKPHEVLRNTLRDQKPDPRPPGYVVATPGGPPVDRAPDKVQAALPDIIEREAGQTDGMASANRAADVAQNELPAAGLQKGILDTPLPVIAKGLSIAQLLYALSVVMVMMAALGLYKILSRRTYAKRGLAFGVQRPQDYERPANLSWQAPNEVEADSGAASLRHKLDFGLFLFSATVVTACWLAVLIWAAIKMIGYALS